MAIIQLRVQDDVKEEATELFEKLGLDLSTAIRIFLARSISEKGLPFELHYKDPEPVDVSEALKALEHAQEISKKNGNDKMTMEEIDEEIHRAREERKRNS